VCYKYTTVKYQSSLSIINYNKVHLSSQLYCKVKCYQCCTILHKVSHLRLWPLTVWVTSMTSMTSGIPCHIYYDLMTCGTSFRYTVGCHWWNSGYDDFRYVWPLTSDLWPWPLAPNFTSILRNEVFISFVF
jgi:hypothetical protein